MAVQAQFGGLLPAFGGAGLADEQQLQALLLSAAAGSKAYQQPPTCAPGVASAAQSELTCNGGGGVAASRKRGREGAFELEQYVTSSSAALLPIPGVQHDAAQAVVARRPPPSRTVADPATEAASTSGRAADALVSELCRQGAEVDALVRAECERMRAGIEQARKRQRQALVRAVAASAARALREKEAALEAARRRAAELEERLRQAAAESQAWCGLARSNEAVAAGLRASLDALLLRAAASAGPAEEGFGESDDPGAAADDALSCCFAETAGGAASSSAAASNSKRRSRWACRACGAAEATVLVLPCRHLCLCKACEPRADACPVCLAAKNASIHVAAI